MDTLRGEHDLAGVQKSKSAVGGVLPGENLQNFAEHGEKLLDFPTFSITLDIIEIVSEMRNRILSSIFFSSIGDNYHRADARALRNKRRT